MRKKITSLVVVIAILVSTLATPAHALAISDESDQTNTPPYIESCDNTVATAIENADYVTSALIAGEWYTYYYGENYTIVYDGIEFSRIDLLPNGEITLNGVVCAEVQNPRDPIQNIPRATSNGYEWVPYDPPFIYSIDVIGIAPGILGGIIGTALSGPIGALAAAALGAEVAAKASTIFSIVGGAIIGTIVGGAFDSYYITINTQRYYKSPVETQRPVTKAVNKLYHGPTKNSTQNLWFTI